MGQFALGIRSLLFKAAIFVVLAALLAWALGGTLFPRPSRAEFPAANFAGHAWVWRVSVFDRRAFESREPLQLIEWQLLRQDVSEKEQPLADFTWKDVAGPVNRKDRLHFAGIGAGKDKSWAIYAIDESAAIVGRYPMPDRLAVEQQLARIEAGLPIQDSETIERERRGVLEPGGDSADESSNQEERGAGAREDSR